MTPPVNSVLFRSGNGRDTLTGGTGNDFLVGGAGGDTYRFASRLGDPGWGRDVIRDAGDKATYLNTDLIELSGLYGPSDATSPGAYARMAFSRSGNDMVISVDDGVSSITVQNMFHDNINRWDIENL